MEKKNVKWKQNYNIFVKGLPLYARWGLFFKYFVKELTLYMPAGGGLFLNIFVKELT